MKRMLFRIISLMLVLSMTLGGIVVPAWAKETENTETTPPETVPSEETVPETTVPPETVPETTVPEETVPETTEPEETVPETTVPEETEPVELPPVITSDGHYIASPSLLEQFEFPDNWSRSALEFCVGNRIISGRDDGLAPNADTTRAETAAILVRLMGAQADPTALSGYQDVNPAAWYYNEVSAAVSVGLMKGTSDTTIAPNAKLTREDACVLLSRAFGILPVYHDRYSSFADGSSVSSYARSAVSGLAERGILKGYGDNTIRPKANITRAELAKLVYGLVTHVCDTPQQLPSAGQVLYRGWESIPEGYTLSGDLTVGYGYTGSDTLSGVTVSDRLILCCEPGRTIELIDCSLFRLVVSSRLNVNGDTAVNQLFVGGEGSSIEVNANTAYAYSGCTLNGAYGQLNVTEEGICVILDGTAVNSYMHRSYSTLQGSGYSDAVDIYGRNCKVTLNCGKLTDHIYLMDYYNSLGTVQTVSNWYQFQRREPYSTATMEGFVNQKGYSSDTEYLIWVSTTTTTVNVFKGSKGNWKLEKSMACALGAPYSPTVKGTFKTFLRDNEWDFGAYKCRWVTYFYNGYAFHSRKWSPSYSHLVDPSINCLVSAGCVRMYDEDCYYIYSTIPMRTTVVVY